MKVSFFSPLSLFSVCFVTIYHTVPPSSHDYSCNTPFAVSDRPSQ
eukprot:UN09722